MTPADGLRAPAIMKPAPVVLRVVRVRKARERKWLAREREAGITRDALLARVEDAHPKQLAVVLIREGQELRHGTAQRVFSPWR